MTLKLLEAIDEVVGAVPFRGRATTLIKQEINRFWKNQSDDIEYKIENGIPLNDTERKEFIAVEQSNIEALQIRLPAVIEELVKDSPNLLEDLIGKHQYNLVSRGRDIHKYLLFVDDDKRYYVDIFAFGPKAVTFKHSHNAYCSSFQIAGELSENVYDEEKPGETQWIRINKKTVGTSTVVSPYDLDNDVHEIVNSGTGIAATLHVYSQRVIKKGNVVETNHGNPNVPDGPTAVRKYLNKERYGLILKPERSEPVERFADYVKQSRSYWTATVA